MDENVFHLILWSLITIITYALYVKKIDVNTQLYILTILYAFVTSTYFYSVFIGPAKKK